jgi:hypothetical protein
VFACYENLYRRRRGREEEEDLPGLRFVGLQLEITRTFLLPPILL